LREDNTTMSQQINQLNYLISKLKSELAEKDMMIGRSMNDNDHELQVAKQQFENKRHELAESSKANNELRIRLKDQENEFERRRRELAERSNMFESKARKYKEEYSRICDILKSKINDTINNTVVPGRR
jgi:predicted  nucleic acid-binding Zn-ribbon protein